MRLHQNRGISLELRIAFVVMYPMRVPGYCAEAEQLYGRHEDLGSWEHLAVTKLERGVSSLGHVRGLAITVSVQTAMGLPEPSRYLRVVFKIRSGPDVPSFSSAELR
jgi:hypothetical protein